MSRILSLYLSILSTIFLVSCFSNEIRISSDENILLIVVDDLRYDALNVNGNINFQSPGIDRLAMEGMNFTNAFVTTSLCSPSRASILTGLYASRHGVTNNNKIFSHENNFIKYLRMSGYKTYFVGKWHMGESSPMTANSFDEYFSLIGQGEYIDPRIDDNGSIAIHKGHITDILTQRTIEILSRDREGPFFLMHSFKSVHGPWLALEENRDLYGTVFSKSELPPSYFDRLQCPDCVIDSVSLQTINSLLKKYYETLAGVDQSVSDIYDLLERKNLLDNTTIIFTSDNGYLFGEHGRLDKRIPYEEVIRIPLIIKSKDFIPANTVNSNIVLNIDIAPTILEIANTFDKPSFDGISILSQLNGSEVRSSFKYEYFKDIRFECYPEMTAIRTSQYKLIQNKSNCSSEFYDIINDPLETENLYDFQDYRYLIDSLKNLNL